MNQSAALVWRHCDGAKDIGEIAAVVGRDVIGSARVIEADVESTVARFATEGLLEPSPQPATPEERFFALRDTPTTRFADRMLRSRDWTYHLGPFQALDFGFTVCLDHRELAEFLSTALDSLPRDDPSTPVLAPEYRAPARYGGAGTGKVEHSHSYSIRSSPGSGRLHLLLDGTVVARNARPGIIADLLLWHLNRMAVASCLDVVLHAGAVQVSGVTVVLPGVADAGKSTQVAGLVARGAAYLTDEAVAIDPQSADARPFPKPITLTRKDIPGLEGVGSDPGASLGTRSWYLPPASVHAGATGTAAPIDLLVFPSYAADGDNTLVELKPSVALVELLRHTFAHPTSPPGSRHLETLAALVERVRAFRLRTGDLVGACQTIEEAVARRSGGGDRDAGTVLGRSE